MRVLAVRHGQSEYNLEGLCNSDPGRPVHLTALGRDQARLAAERLLAEGVEQIYCSALPRARETADLIAARLGLPVRVDARLNDIRSGCEDRPVQAYFAAIADDPIGTRLPGGESLLDYAHRVGGFLDEVAQEPSACILLVAHEETLRIVQAWAQGLSLEQVVGRPYANADVYAFDRPGKRGGSTDNAG